MRWFWEEKQRREGKRVGEEEDGAALGFTVHRMEWGRRKARWRSDWWRQRGHHEVGDDEVGASWAANGLPCSLVRKDIWAGARLLSWGREQAEMMTRPGWPYQAGLAG
jgi:hypothetical protein